MSVQNLSQYSRELSVQECLDRGASLLKEGNIQQAIEIYQQGLQYHTNSASIYFKLGIAFLEQGNLSEAYDNFYKSVALEADFHWGHYGLGLFFAQQGKLSEAVDAYQQALTLNPDDYLIHQKLGEIFLDQNQLDLAEQHLFNVIRLNEKFHWAYYRLGQVYERLLKLDEAKNSFLKAIEIEPDFQLAKKHLTSESFEEVITKADSSFNEQNYQQALTMYEVSLAFHSQHYHSMLRKGECLFRLKKYSEAEQTLLIVNQQFGDQFWLLICLGEVYFHQSKTKEAILSFEKAINLDNKNLWCWHLLGKSYQTINEYQQANICFNKVVEIDPHNALGYLGLAELAKEQGNKSEAQVYWCKAIEIQPQNKWSYISLGYSYIEDKKIEQAEEVFNQAISLFEKDFDVIFAAAHAYLAKRDWTQSAQMLEKALLICPDNEEVKVRLLELYCYSGNLDKALGYFNSLKITTTPPHSYYQAVAKLFCELGEWEKAFDFAAEAILKEPTNIHNHSLFIKVVRKSKKFKEALNVIEQEFDNQEIKTSFLLIKTAILEQLIEPINEARQCVSLMKKENSLSRDLVICENRLRLKENIFSEQLSQVESIKTKIFYCTDKAYSLPTLVSIFSLHKHNKHKLKNNPIYVVADHPTLELIKEAYQVLAHNLNLIIEFIDIESLFKGLSDYKLTTGYGVFTGGDSLSRTAYYRLFFGQVLNDISPNSRWLYIDSDTIILDSLEEIDYLDFNGYPIAARRERPKSEIEEAIKTNNLKSGKYYNSGVIAFDSTHPQLTDLLNKAVRIAVEEGHKLLYHDQCALNIAFDGQIADLSPRFNDFYPPYDQRTFDELLLSDQSLIIHLLDRPKPWDSLNKHQGSILWFQLLEDMSRFLPAKYLYKLFEVLQASI
ncbi:glycosyl transferase family 8 [Stanieria cyanosphaera PCC 7437]|uniref:Glycosyl transferase family 8 n=1 Tax=Stanieria cyanosphaera (strain ATCC 29371 / PCC 7437) TaxID=111780 RepID=K9XUP8_STAC7|nr:tetratricopeptide repeat protein [Stanieria cyanosphaera]AFZ36263.1 glycosyl transferase family 8 [Stanieria cyanosphaera PCC 7437]